VGKKGVVSAGEIALRYFSAWNAHSAQAVVDILSKL
jgi:hypothetical protein